ncbi:MAG: SDR family oxidoreductase [Candidatus Hydrogenedentes bacterium]|nr:SDR family oxidoreductase [Candidatus Hydrogenedentota bacterium]
MRVLIAGCGYVGSALAARLVADNHEVWGLRRNPDRLPEDVRPIAADISDARTLRDLPSDLDYVFYTAAAGGYEEARYQAAYVQGPRNLLDALSSQDSIKRVFFTSSTGVYTQQDGEWVDETSPAEATHFSGKAMLDGERMFREGPFPATSVRLGGIYGPGRAQTLDRIRDRVITCPAEPSYLNLVHRDDCAGILHHLMQLDNPEELYLGVDCEPAERGEMYRWLANMLGVPEPPTDDAEPEGRRTRGNKRCSNARILATGYTFLHPTYREGFQAAFAPRPVTPPVSSTDDTAPD